MKFLINFDFRESHIQDYEITRLRDYKITRLRDYEITRLRDYKITRLQPRDRKFLWKNLKFFFHFFVKKSDNPVEINPKLLSNKLYEPFSKN